MNLQSHAVAGSVSARALSATNARRPLRSLPPLATHKLRDVVNDTKSRPFCGPTAVAAITGAPISVVRDAFRLARYGRKWLSMPRSPAIKGTWPSEVTAVLSMFGYIGNWAPVSGRPTLARWLDERKGVTRTNPCIMEVTGHVVATSGWQFCDTSSSGVVVEATEALGRRARVRAVFVVRDRVPWCRDIPTKVSKRDAQLARVAFRRRLRELNATCSIETDSTTQIHITLSPRTKLVIDHDGDWAGNLRHLNGFLAEPDKSGYREKRGLYHYP